MFTEIPRERPDTPLLDTVNLPVDLRSLSEDQLPQLAGELRAFLLYTVGQTGGHFGAGLGVVELSIALHYVFATPDDKVIWDVGHQAYPHKILTGRREQMATLRQRGGLAPFPSRQESEFDVLGVGHSSTSISAALGIALAATGDDQETVVVIGDGAMTAGMAFEALNHVAATNANLTIVLNDNAMSISENVGGLANYFARNISSAKFDGATVTRQSAGMARNIFTDLGFSYTGPVDGHDLPALLTALGTQKAINGPKILHVTTKKGKGYAPAEEAPVASHAMTKIEKSGDNQVAQASYASLFGQWIREKATGDTRLVAITPAMKEGSSLTEFAEVFPERFHDVAIAEQHAVTLAAGLAIGGAKPVVAIYSTFLQRGYDQLIHDVALQNLDVLFAVDRASLLEDGPTHSGVFDLSFTRSIPNITVMAPASAEELIAMLDFGYTHPGPVIVRYPRGSALQTDKAAAVDLGKANVIQQGKEVALLSFGSALAACTDVAQANNYSLIDMRFVKPLDADTILQAASDHDLLVTVEENTIAGGAGSAVAEVLTAHGDKTPVLILGVPDEFIDHDSPDNMRASCGIDAPGILNAISERLKTIDA